MPSRARTTSASLSTAVTSALAGGGRWVGRGAGRGARRGMGGARTRARTRRTDVGLANDHAIALRQRSVDGLDLDDAVGCKARHDRDESRLPRVVRILDL